MPTKLKESAINDARREWNKTIQDILQKATAQVDPSIRVATLHASIYRDLGQLEMSSEIWDRFISNAEGSERYTDAVIAAADFLQKVKRIQQAIQILENAREVQSELLEIDAVLGSLYFILGEFKLATEFLQQPVKITKNHILHSRYIEALAMSGQFDKATRELEDYTTTNSEYAEQMLRSLISRVKSEQMLAQGDIEGGKIALREYRNALRSAINADSRNPIPYIRLCRSLLNEYQLTQEKQLLQEALKVADEATATEQQSEQFVVVRADVLQADGQLPRSIDHLMRYLSENPSSSNVRTRLIEAYLDSENIDRALTTAKEGVAVDPSDPTWYRRLGDLYIRANDDRVEGVRAYLQAIQRDPTLLLLMKIDEITRTDQELPNQELLEMAKGSLSKLHPIAGAIEAKALKNLGRNRDAILAMEKSWRAFNQAVKNGWISPQSTASWFLDLQVLFRDDPEAGEAFVRALVNGPLSQHQLAGLAGYYQLVGGEYANKSLEIIGSALAMENSDPDARVRLLMLRGGFLVEAKRYDESADTFRLLAEESNSPLVQNNLAYVVGVYQGKPEEGLRIAKQAAKQAPRNASIIDTVSTMYYLLGEHQKAADSLDFLLQIDPANSKAMAKLSLLYSEELGDPARGIVFAERGRVKLNKQRKQSVDHYVMGIRWRRISI
jgi:tetratricopeptide (TPR) repeat protein